jgi:hypothetical protein
MKCELGRYSEALIQATEVSHRDLRTLATEPVTRDNGTIVVLWHYPGLKSFELTTDYGNVKFSEGVERWFDKKNISGGDRMARFSFRHGSVRATNRLQALVERVQTTLDAINPSEKIEPQIKESYMPWLTEMFGEEVSKKPVELAV